MSGACEYCHEDREGFVKMIGGFCLHNPAGKPGEWHLTGANLKPRKIHFCPMCGRDLQEETHE